MTNAARALLQRLRPGAHNLFAPLVVLIGLPLLAMALVNPFGDFPLNDDWSYALAVRHFAQTSEIRLSEWGAMSQVWQVVYAGLWCKVFGFSFTGLRLLTCLIALVGNLVLYRIFRRVTPDRFFALAGVALVFFNPFTFVMTLSFMTEVHFFFWFCLSFLFALRAFDADRPSPMTGNLWVSSLFASLAFLIRQHGLLVPAALTGALFLDCLRNGRWKDRFLRPLPATLLLPGLTYAGFTFWIRHVHGLSPAFQRKLDYLTLLDWSQVTLNLWGALAYLAWFVLPLSVVVLWRWWPRGDRPAQVRALAVFWIGLVASLAWCATVPGTLSASYHVPYSGTMPFMGNVLYDLGLGPPTLLDVYMNTVHTAGVPRWVWRLATWVVCGAGVLGVMAWREAARVRLLTRFEHGFAALLLLALVVIEIVISPEKDGGLFDRHLVNLLLPGVFLVLGGPSLSAQVSVRSVRVTVVILIAALAWFGVAGTHDYLAWNRARWEGLDFLMQERAVAPDRIDGGFEFNGWYTSPCYPRGDSPANRFERAWWVVRDDYRLFWSRRTVDNTRYAVIQDLPWTSWLRFEHRALALTARRDERSIPAWDFTTPEAGTNRNPEASW